MQNQELEFSAVVNGEMGETREENEKLKLLMKRLMKDYQSLQTHFFDILQQDNKKQADQAPSNPTAETSTDHRHEQNEEESELVSLSLGLKTRDNSLNEDCEKKNNNSNSIQGNKGENLTEDGLALGLGITLVDSSVSSESVNVIARAQSNSFEKEAGKKVKEPRAEIWPASEVLKTMRSIGDNNGEAASQQSPMKKARVSIRARCDTQMMNDGCQWRKYGQKTAKGNPNPRAYYRCTVSPSCPVRKQVQRCAEDISILITTYEGIHNHPLPISATAMASTTSAAASILQSASLTSQPLLRNPETSPTFNLTSDSNPDAQNFSYYQIPKPPHQFNFCNSSISTSNSRPTITLDLASPTLPNTSNIGRFTPLSSLPRYNSSTSLNFPSSSTFSPLQSGILNSPYWSCSDSTYGDFNNNGILECNKIQSGAILNTGKQPLPGNFHQPDFISNHAASQQPFPVSIAAATRAVTANGTGSARFMSMPSSPSVSDQQGSLALFPAPLPSAASKSASGSPDDKSNQLLGYLEIREIP